MSLHEKHMEMIDAVNNAVTNKGHWDAYNRLSGFRDGVRACRMEPDLIAADLEQFARGFEHRSMCCGVFNDWKPANEDV